MESMTHREFQTRWAWLQEQWNNPSRTDYYLIQIAREVRAVLSKNPNQIKFEHLRIKFKEKAEGRKPSVQKAAQWAKARWFGLTGKGKAE